MPDTTAFTLPTMVGSGDLKQIEAAASQIGPGATIVEFGPWIGAISVRVAGAGKLHVVDSFVWTKDHAKRVPGGPAPGESFRPLFERNLTAQGLDAVVHETEFAYFTWTGDAIDMVIIDAPKNAADLQTCLRPILRALAPDARIFLKHGLSPAQAEMAKYVDTLVAEGVLAVPPQIAKASSTLLELTTGPNAASADLMGLPRLGTGERLLHDLGLEPDHPFCMVRMSYAAGRDAWPDAFRALADMMPVPDLLPAWDKLEAQLAKRKVDPVCLAALGECFAAHHGPAERDDTAPPFHKSLGATFRAFWMNNADKPWRAEALHPAVIGRAYDFGYMSWPSKVRDEVKGLDILDVGCGPGLHGLGYLTAGAKSYVGLDPIVRLDRDRAKNLTAKSKEAFGWTPAELDELIPPFQVLPTPLGHLPEKRAYDLATLHNVTEHLHDLEGIFRDISVRLREGGRILYNHHNFYTWNGHHLPPKTVDEIDFDDPAQCELFDWGHVEYDPAPEHYIARGLNRIRLDDIIALTERYFDIEVADELPSKASTGAGRLTEKIKARYAYLSERDFLTQNLYCIATVRI